MNYPEPAFNFHKSIENLIRYWKKDPEFKYIILSYGITPFPYAEVRSNMGNEDIVALPLPTKPYPYASWKDWFLNFLEHQTSIVAEDNKIGAYKIEENKKEVKLIPLHRRPPIEVESRELDPILGK